MLDASRARWAGDSRRRVRDPPAVASGQIACGPRIQTHSDITCVCISYVGVGTDWVLSYPTPPFCCGCFFSPALFLSPPPCRLFSPRDSRCPERFTPSAALCCCKVPITSLNFTTTLVYQQPPTTAISPRTPHNPSAARRCITRAHLLDFATVCLPYQLGCVLWPSLLLPYRPACPPSIPNVMAPDSPPRYSKRSLHRRTPSNLDIVPEDAPVMASSGASKSEFQLGVSAMSTDPLPGDSTHTGSALLSEAPRSYAPSSTPGLSRSGSFSGHSYQEESDDDTAAFFPPTRGKPFSPPPKHNMLRAWPHVSHRSSVIGIYRWRLPQ